MDLNKTELRSLIKEVVEEVLTEKFPQLKKQSTESDLKENYQTVFDETMAKVARGEMTHLQAGEVIAQAHKQFNSDKSESQLDIKNQFEQFKNSVSDWDKEMESFSPKNEESTEDMLQRMKNRTDEANTEAKKALELKKMNEEAAKAKAEMSLKEMKDKLKNG
ncbi:MAG: hypothetical protein ACJAWV_003850 [Flammeovirgaceae bacterium]|jgi:hypothetical protein